MISVAFDIGGTFTDFVLDVGQEGGRHLLKVPSTPADPAEAVLEGLETLLAEAGIGAEDLDHVLHATTIATNAVIERKGAKTALITTAGFRDVLIIGRQKRYETYDLHMDKPAPLVRRRDIHEVDERVGHDGRVIRPLDGDALDPLIDRLAAAGAEAVAVSFLHAYANPAHERAVAERIRTRAPDLAVSISSEVSPKFREYERTNTAVANAYVMPIVERYVGRLQGALAQRGFRHEIFIMQSNGGLVSPDFARAHPIRIVESGPAAGVLMSGAVGAEEGADHVITLDMGGTTAKLGAIDGGEPAISPTFEIDPVRYKKGSGLPINVPAVELLEIGAGGGSIAGTEMGVIAVGPESAGADPGPIAYGRGGTRPTVTDANLVLGYLDADYFNGGAMRLDRDAAAAGIVREIGAPLGLGLEQAAWGIHAVANVNMEHAVRIVSVERGRDPRSYALVAFGGAGPCHAARLARAIGIPRVIVPAAAGVGSAVGLMQAAPKIDVSTTRVLRLDDGATAAIAEIYRGLEMRAADDLTRLGVAGQPVWSRYAYLRYAGQGFEVRADLPGGPIADDYAGRAAAAFHAAYERRHRYREAEAEVEAVDWYLVAKLPAENGRIGGTAWAAPDAGAVGGERPAYFPEVGGMVPASIAARAAIAPGETVAGPAIIEDPDSTTLIPPGDRATISPRGHLIIEIGGVAA